MRSQTFLSAFIGTSFTSVALAAPATGKSNLWQPTNSQSYQIILTDVLDVSSGITPDVDIFDIDLFYTPVETFQKLHAEGKKAICYFSAGTAEDWRPDWSQFTAADKGSCLPEWSGERWLNVRSDNVWSVMQKRIQLASEKGCDGIDPDNMDGYGNDNGLGLTQNDAVQYMRKLAAEAAKYGMSTGLKNAEEIIPSVIDVVQFAVNEECVTVDGGCGAYDGFGKPVYHIEYPSSHNVSPSDREKYCQPSQSSTSDVITVIKTLNLDGWVMYCNGKSATSATTSDGVQKGQHECPANSPRRSGLVLELSES